MLHTCSPVNTCVLAKQLQSSKTFVYASVGNLLIKVLLNNVFFSLDSYCSFTALTVFDFAPLHGKSAQKDEPNSVTHLELWDVRS